MTRVIEPEALEALVAALRERGYRVLGPTLSATGRSSTTSSSPPSELPVGWTDVQEPGELPARAARRRGAVRLRGRAALLEAVPAPAAPAALAGAARRRRRLEVEEEPPDETPLRLPRRALLRAARDRDPGPGLPGRPRPSTATTPRGASDAFIVAVNCFEPGGTCFCVSMGTGPEGRGGYDLALTEILDGEHRLLVEVGSERGAEVLAELPRPRGDADRPRRPRAPPSRAPRHKMGRQLDATDLRGLLAAQPRAPALGRGCRALPDLRQLHDGLPDLLLHERRGHDRPRPARAPSATRVWDSCYSVDYSHIHGGAIRPRAGRATGSG